MFPHNQLSTPVDAHVSTFGYPVKSPLPEDAIQDWEVGGIGLGNTSAGLLYQVWHAFLEIDEDDVGSIYVEAPNTAPVFIFSGLGITNIALAFDQNMRATISYVQLGISKIYWYDPIVPGMVHSNLPAGAGIPQMSLDQKRPFNIADSDICVVYRRSGNLYLCYQRDKYATEILLMPTNYDAIHIGMNQAGSMQIGLGTLL